MDQEKLKDYKLLLGSKSPRRQQLLHSLGLHYTSVHIEVEESYPDSLKGAEIACYLCEKKAEAFDKHLLAHNKILITADTIVWLEGECIGKPTDRSDAIQMLKKISGKKHSVFTGICLKSAHKKVVFHAHTIVEFDQLSEENIIYYIDNFHPFDKAGSYGIQDWIGYIGAKTIEGCYYNVMGFPTQLFYSELCKFIETENLLVAGF